MRRLRRRPSQTGNWRSQFRVLLAADTQTHPVKLILLALLAALLVAWAATSVGSHGDVRPDEYAPSEVAEPSQEEFDGEGSVTWVIESESE